MAARRGKAPNAIRQVAHHRPHLHAFYQDDVGIFAIDTVEIIGGELPRRQRRLVEAWTEIHQTELLYTPLQDLNLFNAVDVDREAHTLVWPNGADFDPAILHDWPDHEASMTALAQRWAAAARGENAG